MSKNHFNICGLTISTTNPDHFRREAKQHAQVAEISIFGHNQEVSLTGMLPNFDIRLPVNSKQEDMV